jgi:ribosomal protein L11 methyltransferase
MKWIAAKVTFSTLNRNLATDLVADIFYSLGLKGVVVDDPQRNPQVDWDAHAVPPPEAPGVTGYFADTADAADQCRGLETALQHLEKTTAIATRVTYTRIDEEDWAEAWKAHFWPEKITDTIVVKPSWREYPATNEEIVLEIDPGMAFGTGTHPTTALCIRLIETHLRAGDAFLDVGTGSGILMIAAAKLGAGNLFGVDNDVLAVGVAEKNIQTNGIQKFTLATGNLVEPVKNTFDMVTANILAEVILDLLPQATAVLKPNGIFICSGIIATKKKSVLAGLEENGFKALDVLEKEEWVAIAARRPTAV